MERDDSGLHGWARAQEVRGFVTNDDLHRALAVMLGFHEFSSLESQNELTLLEADLNSLEGYRRRMTISLDEYDARRQQIRQGILDLLARLEPLRRAREERRPVTSQEAKVRARYLKDLRKHVENLLSASIHNAVFLDLGVEDSPSATHLPWVYRNPDSSQEFTSINQAFEAYDRRLLLLGLPGSGKTTTLQHLTLSLIAEAEKDPEAPIPLLLNLSKFRPAANDVRPHKRFVWRGTTDQDRSFDLWLASELVSLYNVGRSTAESWVETDHIAALLDGLDEVGDERRAAVVRLLNTTFLSQHPEAVVVVCSRVAEYLPLQAERSTRLQLPGAITLQPLSNEQIDQYLSQAGAKGLQTALIHDAALYDLALSPLTLSMMTLAYGKLTAAEISSLSQSVFSTDRRHQLMEFFVARMLQRKERRDRNIPFDSDKSSDVPEKQYSYSAKKVNQYLSWLAVELSVRMQTSCSLGGLFSFFDRAIEGRGVALSHFAIQITKTLYALLLVACITLAVGIRNPHQGKVGFIAAGAVLAGFLLVCTVVSRRPPPKISDTAWGIIVCGGCVPVLAIITRALDAIILHSTTGLSLGGLVLSVVICVLSLQGNPKDQQPLVRRVFLFTFLFSAAAAAFAIFFLGLRQWAAQIAAVTGAVTAAFTYAANSHTNPDNDRPWEDSMMAFLVFTGIWGLSAAWIWIAGVLRSGEAIGAIALALAGIFIASSTTVTILLMATAASLAGAAMGGLDGAVAAAATIAFSGLVLKLISDDLKSNALTKQVQRFDKAIGSKIEKWVLTPLALLVLKLGRKVPFRLRAFVLYTGQALILKPTIVEVEFVHRRLRDYFALRTLIPRLQEHDSVTRIDVIRALGFQGAAAIDPLIEIVSGGTASEREAAVTSLGRIASPEIMGHLESALSDSEPPVRAAAVRGIRKQGGNDRIRLLTAAAADPSPLVRLAVLEAALSEDLRDRAKEFLNDLIVGAASDPDLLRTFAARMTPDLCLYLSHKLSQQVIAHITGWLSDANGTIRANACYLLSGNKDLPGFDRICRLLEMDNDPKVRRAAADALGRFGDPRAGAVLIKGLADQNGYVRGTCAWALNFVRVPEAFAALILALEDSESNVRTDAIITLGSLSNKAAADIMLRLRDRDRRVRVAAARALGNLGHVPAIPLMAKSLRRWHATERSSAADALGKIGGPQAITLLLRTVGDRNESVRISAIKALGQLRAREAVQALRARYGRETEEVRNVIYQAISEIDPSIDENVRSAATAPNR